MSQDGCRHPGKQAPEGLGAMPGQSQLLGQLAVGRLDPIPQPRHRPPHSGGQKLSLGLAGRQDDLGTPRLLHRPPRLASKASVQQQAAGPCALQQGVGNGPLVHRRWNNSPRPDQPSGPRRRLGWLTGRAVVSSCCQASSGSWLTTC
jgi:hypothetical protein